MSGETTPGIGHNSRQADEPTGCATCRRDDEPPTKRKPGVALQELPMWFVRDADGKLVPQLRFATDPALNEAARVFGLPGLDALRPLPGVTDVLVHGSAANGFAIFENGQTVIVTPEELARRVRALGITGDIRLISCDAGALLEGTAARMARAMGSRVFAPTTPVTVLPSGTIASARGIESGMRIFEVTPSGAVVVTLEKPVVWPDEAKVNCTSCDDKAPKASDVEKQAQATFGGAPSDAAAVAQRAFKGADGMRYGVGELGIYRFLPSGAFDAIVPKGLVPPGLEGPLMNQAMKRVMRSYGVSPADGANSGFGPALRAGANATLNGLTLQTPTEGGSPAPDWSESWGDLWKAIFG